ncbi:hypothetical protein GLOIN_2v1829825 [Rhizophagus irregularis DAOM 181602=DAOM 197198]|uniref:Uncharacterized protein n=1 Tax=Rhizophagus irregularis (strain DAOM 181602 / DAOM 197198 / MUCL 43194) TaxID=747089 RepID=A0A2P4Q4B1_RHIID|nr:hypothetical protein GLOIN_2v1829825 [Rhizophagus irregularis DAOM 181602=DAOM 197198]POG72422.1 hypothetical protein GLOIN_2v1829825 [Rhizophagus irregularis DAOM 181602=DAOM 197198]|eukprot:XP_025179288.1 hypothetical protein GLOIN_2v1829825 [Rhizophagus irregularis DAOM 181602=DAOM 197198]
MEMEKDFSSGDDNEYEDLEENQISNDDEYEDLKKNLVDFEKIFSKYKNLEKDLESVIEESSIQSELNNGEPLFEIDRDALANAKKFAQQNVSNEDEDEFSETESGEEHGEEYDEHDEVISELQDNETLSPCVIIDIFEGKIQRCNSKTNLRRLWQMIVKFDYNTHKKLNPKNLTPKHFFEFGKVLANSTILAKHKLKAHKKSLEAPASLEEYSATFPLCLVQFYDGLLTTLYETKKRKLDRQKKYYKQQPKPLNYEKITKQITFFVSIILNIAFKGWKIWLPRTMASLCRKPKLLSSLQEILNIVNITSHTLRHERNLEKIRALLANPTDRIHYNENIWNLGIIDNVDFKKSTFGYENIFDATRGHSHANLRMLFQFQMPESLNTLELQERAQNQQPLLFGQNSYSEQKLNIFNSVFEKLLAFDENTFTYQTNFDGYDIRNQIMKYYKIGCDFPTPNIIILDAGDPPSNDLAVHKCLKMYQNEIDSEYINVVADKAIFRRSISYCKKNEKTKMILGQWHTNKDMMSTLITIFSGYEIFNMAGILGVQFLDKLEKCVDFRATSRVLELIWVSVENNPQLRAMLRTAPTVNLTNPGHFFAYDEALETFGVKFVKQNITRITTDKEELKLRIRATQLEKDRTDMLLCDYIGDNVKSSQQRNVQSRKNKVWELAHLLIDVFESLDLFNHPIFEFCKNLNQEEINQLVTVYDIVAEIARMKKEKKEEEREEKRKEKENKRGKGRGRGRGRDRGRGRGKRRGRGKDRGSGSEKE